ncbi:DNA-3-methyladenine glycosylase family protein [Agathobaculum sp.]|uniref:DNA-3-methyladenine glycosylase family protein n=1 Tax=Agathobaculum sp. TaxID=2048138 RepID=UPI002A7FD3B9|nr:DNA-3-methyladenine glycosylase 2 family protein [Agathobaculum sp.]MDY3618451.1 DNA-3-methyladenine glycosylase 2 family protein [Agathobaculum sp.]
MNYLKAVDPKLGAVIDRVGKLEREVMPDLFEALVNSIAAQQISGKALETVWWHIRTKFRPLTPENVLAQPEALLHKCGLSARKVGYIRAAAEEIVSGALDLDALRTMPDSEVVKRLTKLPGVGPWTAEMLLIFSLQRPDVLSYDDFGIRKGLRMVYGLPSLSRAEFQSYRERFTPCGTVAGLYLWAVAGGALPELTDPENK